MAPIALRASVTLRASVAARCWSSSAFSSNPNVIAETSAIAPAAASTRVRRPQGRRTRALYGVTHMA
jgi:hypothetical protein